MSEDKSEGKLKASKVEGEIKLKMDLESRVELPQILSISDLSLPDDTKLDWHS